MATHSYRPLIVGLFVAWAAAADTVELTNGRTLDGLIARETTNHVVLNMGLGEIKLQRSQIRKIIRSSPAEDARVKAAWQERYFAHKNYVPERLAGLATQFESIVDRRASAVGSVLAIGQLKSDATNLRDQLAREQAEWLSTHERIKSQSDKPQFGSRNEIDSYNSLVAKGNALQSSIVLHRQTVDSYAKQIDTHHANMAAYIRELDDFRDLLGHQEAQSTNEAVFLAQAGHRVAEFDKELRRVELPYNGDGSHAVLDVRINGEQTGKFLLDTGASLVVISRDFARWLKLDINTNETTRLILANGQETDGNPVVLDSVQSGDAKVLDVPAVVMDKPPAPGLDGLLGMSFLRNFVLRFDAAAEEVELIQLDPSG